MMKRFLKAYLLVATAAILSGCDKSDLVETPNNIAKEGKSHMARTKTASGLEYEIIQEGSGASPERGRHVTVHYTGRLEDGTKFDSSVDRGQPFTFIIGVGQVIKGWDEGVMSMKVGEKRQLIIPSELGYGARGAGRLIPPHATLVFDVELLGIS